MFGTFRIRYKKFYMMEALILFWGERIISNENKKLRDLLLKATRDSEFREELLSDPVSVASKYKVRFSDKELEKIKAVNNFVESLKDTVISGPLGTQPPPIYPLDPLFNRWKAEELLKVIKYYMPIRYPSYIAYPVPFEMGRFRRFRTMR